jgi:hypothetical protein
MGSKEAKHHLRSSVSNIERGQDHLQGQENGPCSSPLVQLCLAGRNDRPNPASQVRRTDKEEWSSFGPHVLCSTRARVLRFNASPLDRSLPYFRQDPPVSVLRSTSKRKAGYCTLISPLASFCCCRRRLFLLLFALL